jgi:osmotically-inducible protein OsmY
MWNVPAQEARKESMMHRPNNLVEPDVREAMDDDPRLNDSRIVVKADEGRVTLSGAVDTYPEVDFAAQDARDVMGVKAIDNQLLVGLVGDAIADSDVAAASRQALANDQLVPHGSVEVTVAGGWVDLTGEVRHHFQRQAAQHAVGRVPGVLGVRNKIALTDEPLPPDVAARINKAFKRNAIIDDSVIRVTNDGHTIHLDGVVNSWAAMDTAFDTAWSAPGVQEVVNNLTLID